MPDAIVVLGEYDEIIWFNNAAKPTLGLKKRDKGQRIPNLIRMPAFIEFLGEKDPDAILNIKSPANGQSDITHAVLSRRFIAFSQSRNQKNSSSMY